LFTVGFASSTIEPEPTTTNALSPARRSLGMKDPPRDRALVERSGPLEVRRDVS
jgi:hypothetical protein